MLVSMGVVGGAVLHGVLNFLLGFFRLVGLVVLVVFSMLGRVLPGKDVYLCFLGQFWSSSLLLSIALC